MKKIFSLVICLILLCSIGISASAINIDAIQPDTNVIYVGITGCDVPVEGLHTHYGDGSTLVVIPGEILEGVYRNPITGRSVETTTQETAEQTQDEPAAELPNEDQSVEYNIDHEQLIKDIFELVNQEREKNNVPALTYNKEIQEAADIRAEEAAELFSHTRPDGSSCHDIIELEYYATGENLIKADKEVATAQNLMNSWMNSKSHRDNILLKDFTEMAIGVYEKDGIVYATQIFLG